MSLIQTPFGFTSTAAEVAAGIDLTGRRAVVTGASSGLGLETAYALAATGAEVTLAVRGIEAAERAARDITATTGRTALHVAPLELTDSASVAAFAAWDGPLHILVNNAGVMACPEQCTPQGWEWQFVTGHLGHFAPATGLHAALAADGAARVVMVSSAAGPVTGITVNALMPGTGYTNLQRQAGGRGSGKVPPELIKTPAQGAAASVLLATSPLLEGIGGRYFADCNETETIDHRGDAPPLHGVARNALHPDGAERLWTLSETLLAGTRTAAA